jgi:hypothetical protein
MTKKIVREEIKRTLLDTEKIVDIVINEEKQKVRVISITKYHTVWKHTMDIINGELENYKAEIIGV